jgi:branched-chain amino acid transport system substrate-binding protein
VEKLKKLLIILLIGCILVFLLGCAGEGPDAESEGDSDSAQQDKIVIGALYPHSGPLAQLGDESWRGAELGRQKWNEEGGILGREIVFIDADIPDTSAATAETERLISHERLTVLVGSYSSGLATAASEVAERHQVIYYEMGGIADDIMERGFERLFRACPSGSSFGIAGIQAAAEYAPDALGKELSDIRVAVAFEDGPYGSAVGKYARQEALDQGMNVVAFEPYSSESTDLSPLIERLKAAEPDVLSITSYLTDAILFSEQARELDLYVPIKIGNGGGNALTDWADAIGEDAIGWLNVDFTQFSHNHDATPGIEEFIERYEKEFGHFPRSGHSLMNYFAIQVLFEAIELSEGSLEPADVREALYAIDIPNFTTATGLGADFNTPTNQNARAWPVVSQWDKVDGRYSQVCIFPPEMALREPNLPLPRK